MCFTQTGELWEISAVESCNTQLIRSLTIGLRSRSLPGKIQRNPNGEHFECVAIVLSYCSNAISSDFIWFALIFIPLCFCVRAPVRSSAHSIRLVHINKVKWNKWERERESKKPAFTTLSSGLYRKRIFHLEVTFFYMIFYLCSLSSSSPSSSFYQFSFYFIFFAMLRVQFEFNVVGSLDFIACDWWRFLEGYSFRVVVQCLSIRALFFLSITLSLSLAFIAVLSLYRNRFPIHPEVLGNGGCRARFNKIGWRWKQLQKTVKYFDNSEAAEEDGAEKKARLKLASTRYGKTEVETMSILLFATSRAILCDEIMMQPHCFQL